MEPSVSTELQKGPFVQESLSKFVEGDKIRIESTSGSVYYMYYIGMDGESLTGNVFRKDNYRLKDHQLAKMIVKDIEKLSVYRKSAGATAPLIVGGIVVLATGVFFLLLSGMSTGGGS